MAQPYDNESTWHVIGVGITVLFWGGIVTVAGSVVSGLLDRMQRRSSASCAPC